jgi:hypothetical protein
VVKECHEAGAEMKEPMTIVYKRVVSNASKEHAEAGSYRRSWIIQ